MAKTEHEIFELAGDEVRLSNPDKVYFPQAGVTKGELARYYVEVADAILIHLRERPTVLKRYAGGIEAKPFYQKRVPAKRPDWIETVGAHVPVRPQRRGARAGRTPRTSCGRVSLGNMDWNPHPVRRRTSTTRTSCASTSTRRAGAPWDAVRQVALLARDVLAEHGLRGYPHTSGSRGMHIPVRIHAASGTSSTVRRAALALAREVERRGDGAGDVEVVEGGAPARVGVRRLQPERQGPHGRERLQRPAGRRRARRRARSTWDEVADCEPGDFTHPTPCRRGWPSAATRRRTSTTIPGRSTACSRCRRRTRSAASATRPGRSHFAKQPGEPKRVQPVARANRADTVYA